MSKTVSNSKGFSKAERWQDIDASAKTTSELINIILDSNNASFIIKNIDFTPMSDLKKITKLVSGKVIFEI